MAIKWGKLPWGSIISGLAQVGTSVAANRAKGRAEETVLGQSADRNATDLYGTQQGAALRAAEGTERGALDRADLDLKRREFGLEAPRSRANLAVLGDLLANLQDVQVPDHPRANVVRFAGGLRPSALSADVRGMGAGMRRDAIMNQLAGDTFTDVPATDFTGALQKPPVPTPAPKAGKFDKFLGASSSILAAIAAIQQAQNDEESVTPMRTKPPMKKPTVWEGVRF